MNPHLNAAIAAERRRDMEHAAGCCTPVAEYRRPLRRVWPRRLPRLGAGRPPVRRSACCATA